MPLNKGILIHIYAIFKLYRTAMIFYNITLLEKLYQFKQPVSCNTSTKTTDSVSYDCF